MEIKICGITNLEDATNACSYGADALGFIFYKKSPRYITPEAARHITVTLPRDIARVGVFVNHDIQAVKDIYENCGLNFIQLQGDESPDYCRQLSEFILIKAFAPRNEDDIDVLKDYPVKAILLDSREYGLYGGTGKKSNWEMAARIKEAHPLILAGGLNPDNILEAIEKVIPNAVDVNSGVEVSPQKKDSEKMKIIISVVHSVKRKSPVKIFASS
jgi:phosphoribosylanthranilate isomerase